MNPKYFAIKRKILHMSNNVDNSHVGNARMNYYFRKQLKANGIPYEFFRNGISPSAPYGTLVIESFNLYIEFQEDNYTVIKIVGRRGISWTLRADCIKELWDKMHHFKTINKFQFRELSIQTHLLADQQAKCAL